MKTGENIEEGSIPFVESPVCGYFSNSDDVTDLNTNSACEEKNVYLDYFDAHYNSNDATSYLQFLRYPVGLNVCPLNAIISCHIFILVYSVSKVLCVNPLFDIHQIVSID